ncbi:MAG TPA: dihydropteroate synthase [Planctomycetota bacterium]|nr:dihydropteroate synthase [Planctomycetota bacterium]
MLIVGERINSSRKRIRQAIEKRDSAFIQKEARKQFDAGATYIDVNAGTSVSREVEDLKWLVQTVQAAVDAPLCIDSPSHEAQAQALALHKGLPLVNSITAEKERAEAILPLVKKYNARVVGLTMGSGGMPASKEERMEAAAQIVAMVKGAGICLENLYFDPAVSAVSADQKAALDVAATVKELKTTYEEAHVICGLSNISFGLPQRNVLNRTYLALLMAQGLDAVIIDPTEKHMMATLLAAHVLLGKDDFCMDYIMAEREGRLPASEDHIPSGAEK